MRATLVIGNNYKIDKEDFKNSYIIGVDKGALYLHQNNIKMDLAVGDFDSISDEELKLIEKETKIIKLNPIKDDSDTEHAINLVKDYDEILILGGIQGKRIEHLYAILLYLELSKNIILKDNNSLIYYRENDFKIIRNEYKFISFFSLDDNTYISLKGFKYDLENYNLKRLDPLCLSNEKKEDIVEVKLEGKLLVIETKDDE